jgi:cytochrome P450
LIFFVVRLGRRVLQDFTFSDGTTVPAGSTLYVNSYGLHHDETLFPSPNTFDGFRFLPRRGDPRGELGKGGEEELEFEERLKRQPMMAKPTLDYNAFGYGKNAWCVNKRWSS